MVTEHGGPRSVAAPAFVPDHLRGGCSNPNGVAAGGGAIWIAATGKVSVGIVNVSGAGGLAGEGGGTGGMIGIVGHPAMITTVMASGGGGGAPDCPGRYGNMNIPGAPGRDAEPSAPDTSACSDTTFCEGDTGVGGCGAVMTRTTTEDATAGGDNGLSFAGAGGGGGGGGTIYLDGVVGRSDAVAR